MTDEHTGFDIEQIADDGYGWQAEDPDEIAAERSVLVPMDVPPLVPPKPKPEAVTEQERLLRSHESGLSYAEIARLTGKAPGTVKAAIHKARKARQA